MGQAVVGALNEHNGIMVRGFRTGTPISRGYSLMHWVGHHWRYSLCVWLRRLTSGVISLGEAEEESNKEVHKEPPQ